MKEFLEINIEKLDTVINDLNIIRHMAENSINDFYDTQCGTIEEMAGYIRSAIYDLKIISDNFESQIKKNLY